VILVFGGNGQLGRELARAAALQSIPMKTLSHCEADIANPLNVYGCTKAAGERVVRSVLDRHVILRTAWDCRAESYAPSPDHSVQSRLKSEFFTADYFGNWGAKRTSGGHCQSVADDPTQTFLLRFLSPAC
jgi:nucleoside-diphosphate-sugar epimerase